MHHFMWDTNTSAWVHCGSELVPFGCQHGISALDLVALLADTEHSLQPAAFPDASLELQKLGQPRQQQHLCMCAEVVLDVLTAPKEVLVGWEGPEQEQQLFASPGPGAGVVLLLARVRDEHVPVTILECTPKGTEGVTCPTGTYPAQKQVRLRAPGAAKGGVGVGRECKQARAFCARVHARVCARAGGCM